MLQPWIRFFLSRLKNPKNPVKNKIKILLAGLFTGVVNRTAESYYKNILTLRNFKVGRACSPSALDWNTNGGSLLRRSASQGTSAKPPYLGMKLTGSCRS